MAARELIVILLNYTNEELAMDPQSPHLEQGEWMTDTPESQPPAEIMAGESGMWRCKSRHVGAGTVGSVSYRIVRYGEKDKITLSWDIRYVGSSKFEYTVEAEEFTMRVLGGGGKQAVAVFVFET
ncbi:lysophospholipase Plb1 [Metarhizium guizhouense ARSEF 977]|uniref:Lysophospholipase Plb1 n=1 Tax=Metarhizium guizhouense (strain ARSEF 977) TaxID=1276136 RepID=A0A0B4GP86_METGA|nr:lysophospholipase Plb1 [Metarhizium guizhouense ARSEF 977]